VLTILLTRHGETDKSHPEQYLGQRIRARLTDAGRAAATALGDRLELVQFGRVIASPLERAVETARLIRPGAEIETDARLMEADYGAWEGHTVEEIEAGWPEERAAWQVDPAANPTPGGESGGDVARRVGTLLDELVEWGDGPDERLALLVGHSTVNRVLLTTALGTPLRDYRRRFRQDWANLTVLRFGARRSDGALLLVANDVAHVRGVRGATWD
jgi:ribonuclease H / adenosylcobalamin/alpha-ribazole phosphatase